MTRHIFVFVLSIVLLTACANGESSAGDASADGGDTPQTGTPQDGDRAAPPASGDFAPITTHGGGATGGTDIGIPGATFALPAAWQREAPSSSMRAAQAQIPGDGGAGQLTVFFFGVGGGGGTEGNIQRWIGQVEVDPANPAVRETFSGPGTKVTWVEARGTIKPSTMGVGPTEPQPDSVLLGAVVEGAGGPWYFKATGPAATMDPQKDAFLAMLGTVAPASGG